MRKVNVKTIKFNVVVDRFNMILQSFLLQRTDLQCEKVFFFKQFCFLLFFIRMFQRMNRKTNEGVSVLIVRAYHVNVVQLNEQRQQLMLNTHRHHRQLSFGMNGISKYRHMNVSYCLCRKMSMCTLNAALLPFF